MREPGNKNRRHKNRRTLRHAPIIAISSRMGEGTAARNATATRKARIPSKRSQIAEPRSDRDNPVTPIFFLPAQRDTTLDVDEKGFTMRAFVQL
jgi:hypothetical protein